jgi:ubiquinone/menaquinone biosynthesis C-methylase UbiE
MSTLEATWCRSAPWRMFAQKVVLPWALQGVAPAGRVLEIGGGSGAMAEQLLTRFPALQLTVTDFDPAMVDVAGARLLRFGDRAAVDKADATALPFDDESYDAVLSFIMLHHVGDWQEALRECLRVVRPGGHVVGYDLIRSEGIGKVDDLRALAATLPLTESRITPSFAGLTVRFRFTKER